MVQRLNFLVPCSQRKRRRKQALVFFCVQSYSTVAASCQPIQAKVALHSGFSIENCFTSMLADLKRRTEDAKKD